MKLSDEFKAKFYRINGTIIDGHKVELWESVRFGDEYPAQLVVDDERVDAIWDDIYTAYDQWKEDENLLSPMYVL